jgi:hypothetical protein
MCALSIGTLSCAKCRRAEMGAERIICRTDVLCVCSAKGGMNTSTLYISVSLSADKFTFLLKRKN